MAEPTAERPMMSDYGVDTPDWEALPWSWAAERLAATRNFWLVTASADGRPHSMPVWGVWHDGDHRFYFSCSPNARKARNLAVNPQATVTTEDTVEAISVEGRVTPIEGDRMETWISRYLDKYRGISPELSGDFLRAHANFELTPDRALAIIEREEEFATRATRWRFPSD